MELMIVVLPVPGPPVMTDTPSPRQFMTARFCCSLSSIPVAASVRSMSVSGRPSIGFSEACTSARRRPAAKRRSPVSPLPVSPSGRSWLSALILSPVLAYMGLTLYDRCSFCMRHFPHYIVTCIFCILQAAVYVCVFFPQGWYKKLIGLLIPVAAAAVMAFSAPQASVDATAFLPDDPVLSEQAVIITGEGGFADISIRSTGENSMLRITAERYGTMAFSIRDGDREYSYTLTVYEDEEGHSQIRITGR
jgi:hypothetical protein